MNEFSGEENLRDKSRRSLEAAHDHFAKGDYDFAVSRLYYAMFYLAEALLGRRGKAYASHSALLSGFYHTFIATGEFPKQLHALLHEAYDLRQKGDYGPSDAINESRARKLLVDATEFVQAITKKLDAE